MTLGVLNQVPKSQSHGFRLFTAQITIDLRSELFELVNRTDLSKDDIIVSIVFDDLVDRSEQSANAFLKEVSIAICTRVDWV